MKLNDTTPKPHRDTEKMLSVQLHLSLVPCSVWSQVATLYVDGAELLQGVLVGGGQSGVGQRRVRISFCPAAATAQR